MTPHDRAMLVREYRLQIKQARRRDGDGPDYGPLRDDERLPEFRNRTTSRTRTAKPAWRAPRGYGAAVFGRAPNDANVRVVRTPEGGLGWDVSERDAGINRSRTLSALIGTRLRQAGFRKTPTRGPKPEPPRQGARPPWTSGYAGAFRPLRGREASDARRRAVEHWRAQAREAGGR